MTAQVGHPGENRDFRDLAGEKISILAKILRYCDEFSRSRFGAIGMSFFAGPYLGYEKKHHKSDGNASSSSGTSK